MYYIIYPLLYLLSLLPFFILYGISNFIAFLLYHIIKYRKEVVFNNLKIAFPTKTEAELLLLNNFTAILPTHLLKPLNLFLFQKNNF